ncbi:hypothetical protein ACEU2D_23520 [Brevibacillus laterosporus]|uniref:hypothetical protein n=1 Tax=Brevibacillus laterosporus TaxID=1465 RepID=UPI0035A5F73A
MARIYAVSEGKLIALLPNGQKKWGFDTASKEYDHTSAPKIASDGTIYLGSSN